MVTVREDGRERRITAGEAFVLQLTKRALEGDGSATRASLDALGAARAKRVGSDIIPMKICMQYVDPGSVGCAAKALNIGIVIKPRNAAAEIVHIGDIKRATLLLAPWIVEAALARLGRHLDVEEQKVVWHATRTPKKVDWPKWWSVGKD